MSLIKLPNKEDVDLSDSCYVIYMFLNLRRVLLITTGNMKDFIRIPEILNAAKQAEYEILSPYTGRPVARVQNS